jgi:predicted membrane protein
MKKNRLKDYFPAVFLFFLGGFFLLLPFLAVFLVVGSFFLFGLIYAFTIYKLHQLQNHMRRSPPESVVLEPEESTIENPSFRRVTTYIVKNKRVL